MKNIVNLLFLGLLVTGCIVSNTMAEKLTLTKELLAKELIVGSTTQDDVKKRFGEPDNKRLFGNKESWFYDNHSLMIEFDAYTFVEEYTIIE